MGDERFERLQREHDFEAWANRGTEAIAGDLELEFADLPGWQPLRTRHIDTMDPPVTKVMLARGDAAHVLVAVEAYRCASLRDAHELLLRMLGSFQTTALREQPNAGIGDVAFGIGDPTMVVFARANYVVHVRNAGPELTDVMSVARALDERIAGMPA
ncbi:MAG TPA: hypothetical protein VFF00_07340 [Candidatus Elarobacter sp.]|nr:hypothetical protein [Candidatus Elarobacter sp.]